MSESEIQRLITETNASYKRVAETLKDIIKILDALRSIQEAQNNVLNDLITPQKPEPRGIYS